MCICKKNIYLLLSKKKNYFILHFFNLTFPFSTLFLFIIKLFKNNNKNCMQKFLASINVFFLWRALFVIKKIVHYFSFLVGILRVYTLFRKLFQFFFFYMCLCSLERHALFLCKFLFCF